MINLAIFCPECTLWLVLMLLGAWILGWVLWSLIKGTKYQSIIQNLESQTADLTEKNTDLREQNTALHTNLRNEQYSLEKRNGEYEKLNSKFMDLDLKYKVQGESLANTQTAYEKLKVDFDGKKS